MEITKYIEQNPTILRLGLHLEYNDARHRISAHLQRNLDRSKFFLLIFCSLIANYNNLKRVEIVEIGPIRDCHSKKYFA